MEYPGSGGGDYREGAIRICTKSGRRTVLSLYKGHKIYPGKPGPGNGEFRDSRWRWENRESVRCGASLPTRKILFWHWQSEMPARSGFRCLPVLPCRQKSNRFRFPICGASPAFPVKGFRFVDNDFFTNSRNRGGVSSSKLVYLRTIFINFSAFAVASSVLESSLCKAAAFSFSSFCSAS